MLMPSIFGENLFDTFLEISHFIMMTEQERCREETLWT